MSVSLGSQCHDFVSRWNPRCASPRAASLDGNERRSPRGAIMGSVELVDVLDRYCSAVWWKFEGQHGFVLKDARPHTFVPCKGALNFWQVPSELGLSSPW